jgi:hypothetical protein
LLPSRASSERPAIAAVRRSRPRPKTNDNGRARRSQPPKRFPPDGAGSRICGTAASTLLRETEVFGFVLGARTGRGRTRTPGDTDRTCLRVTRSVGLACPELVDLGRLGLSTGRLAATFVVVGGRTSGTGRTSTPGCVGSVFGATGAASGSVVGETTLGEAGASKLPEVLGTWATLPVVVGTWASGSEVVATGSSDASQVVEAGA